MDATMAYEEVIVRFKQTRLLDSIRGVLEWDERVYMPPRGSAHRAEQVAYLAKVGHAKLTDPVLGQRLAQVEDTPLVKDADSVAAVNVREIRRMYDRAVKVPAALVEELARTCTRAQRAWQEARKHDDFKTFQPWLEKIVKLKREEAQAVGYRDVPYDALLDEYEPGATTAEVTHIFAALRQDLVPLVSAITAAKKQPRRDILQRDFPIERQQFFGQAAAAAIGFDFIAGRLDITAHPFC